MFSQTPKRLGKLRESQKQSHHFFPNHDPSFLPELRKILELPYDAPDPERVRASEQLQVRFQHEDFKYASSKYARKLQTRPVLEGEEFPVKSWLQGEWVLKPEKKKRKMRKGKGGGSHSAPQHHDSLLACMDGQKVDLDSLQNKYVMICFFFVPTLVDNESVSQRLLDLSSELYSSKEKNYKDEMEIILVVKMRKGWESNRDAFYQFVHAFPPQCLSVPFHSSCRERLFDSTPFCIFPAAILVGPNHKVVQGTMRDQFFDNYGSALYYPFTNAVLERDCEEYERVREMLDTGVGFKSFPLPPHKLLWNTYRDFRLQNSLQPEMQINMSELISNLEADGKHMYLYLCVTGIDLLRILVKLYELRNGDVDIVLVYTRWEADLSEFKDIISGALVKNNISCWILPFDNSASHRLSELCEAADEDKLICVEPSGKYVDPYAANVFVAFGVNAYPFTRGHIIVKEYERLKKVTLNSLLFSGPEDNVFDPSNKPARKSQLAYGDTLIYFESALAYRGRAGELYPKEVFDKVTKQQWYAKLMTNHSSLRVLFVCFNELGSGVSMESRGQMPWFVCPFNSNLIASMTSQLSVMGGQLAVMDGTPDGYGCVMSFRDGRLCSISAHSLLSSSTEALFSDHLREDIMSALKEGYHFMEELDPDFNFGC